MGCNFCTKCIKMADGLNKKQIKCTNCHSIWIKKIDDWIEMCDICEENKVHAEALDIKEFGCRACNRFWINEDGQWIMRLVC